MYFNFSGKRYNASEILELNGDFSEKNIKHQYRTLIKKYHPDNYVNEDSEVQKYMNDKLQLINIAYEKLLKKDMTFDDSNEDNKYYAEKSATFKNMYMKIDILRVLFKEDIENSTNLIGNLKELFNKKISENGKVILTKIINILVEKQNKLIEYYKKNLERDFVDTNEEELQKIYGDATQFLSDYKTSSTMLLHEIFDNDIAHLSDFFKYSINSSDDVYALIVASCNFNKLINDVCSKSNVELDNEMKRRLIFNVRLEENLIQISDLQKNNPISQAFLKSKLQRAVNDLLKKENSRKVKF